MAVTTTMASLSAANQRLVRLMQKINYGRIEGLSVRRGEPVMDPPPRVVRDLKFGGDNGPRPEVAKADFTLKTDVREFLTQLEAIGDGMIPCIEIQRGLPFQMSVLEAFV